MASDTPRADAPLSKGALRKVAREIERENAKLQGDLRATEKGVENLHRYISSLQEENAMLLEALKLCMNAVKLAGWEGDYCMDKARAAIAAVEAK